MSLPSILNRSHMIVYQSVVLEEWVLVMLNHAEYLMCFHSRSQYVMRLCMDIIHDTQSELECCRSCQSIPSIFNILAAYQLLIWTAKVQILCSLLSCTSVNFSDTFFPQNLIKLNIADNNLTSIKLDKGMKILDVFTWYRKDPQWFLAYRIFLHT